MLRPAIKRGRKAQVTIFLIIGLIILISAGIYFYVQGLESTGEYTISKQKSAPVERFIEECMQRVGRDAIDLAGRQGGFVNFPEEIQYNPSRYVYVIPPIAGTEDFAPRVPIWWYNGVLKYPEKAQTGGDGEWIYTEGEVSNYVEENLRTCFNNFDSFRNEFDFNERSDITAWTTFNREDVTIKIDYKLDIIHKGTNEVTQRDGFVTRLPVKFKKMMDAAEEIATQAVEQLFFENVTFNLMSAMPEDAPDGLPLTGLQFHCGTLTWNMYSIRDRLIDALTVVIGGIRFDDSDHTPFRGEEKEYEKFRGAFQKLERIDTRKLDTMPTEEILFDHLGGELPPEDAYEYFQLFFKFAEKEDKFEDLVIGVEYRPDFGMNFLASPSSNGVMRSSVADFRHKLMSLLCLNYYHFVYNVRYPILITIKDPEAYNGEGATFKFAYLVTIANNQPDKAPRPAEFFEQQDVSPDFCDPINRVGKPADIIAQDKITGWELDGVNISYKCFNSFCYLGETETNNQRFQLSTNLPEGCSRGIIYAEKPGYLDTEVQILQTPFFFDMYPVINLSYKVAKVRSTNVNPTTGEPIPRPLDPRNEHVAIDISSKDPEYNYFGVFDPEDLYNFSHNIELIKADDVTYNVNMYLFKNIGEKDIMIGGWMGNWTPDLSELKDLDKLTFQVIEMIPTPGEPTDQDYESTVAMFEFINNQSNYERVVPKTISVPLTEEVEQDE